jgi:ergothioneine biosynthesis protein EgtB
VAFEEGVRSIGWEGEDFAYDNERPRHRTFLEAFTLGHRLVTNGEYLEFMADGGYERPELWMSEGWARVQEDEWSEPFYWERRDGEWWSFTLWGMRPVDEREPVCHVSWYEAEAFARWAGARLPREEEWEVAAGHVPIRGNLGDTGRSHPAPAVSGGEQPLQLFGDVWEWTSSPYTPYPQFRPEAGAVGEYNGKFMVNQLVLRGGSCVTPGSHIRPTYRNFFHADAAWQFSGIRLARDP